MDENDLELMGYSDLLDLRDAIDRRLAEIVQEDAEYYEADQEDEKK